MPKANRVAILAAFALVCFGAGTSALAQSENVTLVRNFDPRPGWHSDIWGYTSPGGIEIAILGCGNGTSFINVTDPQNPVEVGWFSGSSSVWRDMKTYGHYAYIVCDDGSDGLKIVDLDDPLNPTLVLSTTTYFSRSHNVWVDQDRGLLMCVGTNSSQNVQVFDLVANPANPPRIYTNGSFYTHDMYSRNGVAYMAAIYDGTLNSQNMNMLPASMPTLGTVSSDDNFTHNVWLTEDGNFALTTDEVGGGHLTIFDVSDPSNMFKVASYTNPRVPGAIVHNVLVKGSFAYVAWYTAGLEIIDISVPSQPQQVGYYDEFPGNQASYDGAWGVYAFAESGHIYVSDISTGLWIFDFDPTFGSVEGTITDSNSGLPIEGATVSVQELGIERTTGANGVYRINLDPGTYDLEVAAFGYPGDTDQVTIIAGETAISDFQLAPLPTGSLSGMIVNGAAAGGGLAGATIELLGTPLETTSAPNGSYSFPQVPEGAYSVQVSLFRFGATEGGVSIQGGLGTQRDFSLLPSPIAIDLETAAGWTAGAAGDNASTGIWTRVEPLGTYTGGGTPIQPEDDHTTAPGQLCYVTGQGTDPFSVGENDVDNGHTTLRTATYDLSAVTDPTVRFHRWYVNDGNGSVDDVFKVDVSSNNGATWINLETLGETRRLWERTEFFLTDYITVTNQVTFRFIAEDEGSGSIVEAGIDDFEIFAQNTTTDAPETAPTTFVTRLLPASPNPMLGTQGSLLRFQLSADAEVTLEIVDVSGRRIAQILRGAVAAGDHSIAWDGRDDRGQLLPGGVYFQKLSAAGAQQTGKITILR